MNFGLSGIKFIFYSSGRSIDLPFYSLLHLLCCAEHVEVFSTQSLPDRHGSVVVFHAEISQDFFIYEVGANPSLHQDTNPGDIFIETPVTLE